MSNALPAARGREKVACVAGNMVKMRFAVM